MRRISSLPSCSASVCLYLKSVCLYLKSVCLYVKRPRAKQLVSKYAGGTRADESSKRRVRLARCTLEVVPGGPHHYLEVARGSQLIVDCLGMCLICMCNLRA